VHGLDARTAGEAGGGETGRTHPSSKLPMNSRLPSEGSGDRIVALDAVRGFALLGIAVVHAVEQYAGSPPPPSEPNLGVFTVADQVTRGLVALLFMGKFFAMFSLLFGLSFFVQMDAAARRKASFAGRFAWRLGILFAIGMAHHLVYRGDILAIYAVLWFVLLPLFRVPNPVLVGLAAAIALGVHRLVLAAATAGSGGPIELVPLDPAATEAYFRALRSGTPADVLAHNLTHGFVEKLYFLFGWFGRGWQTLALFLFGLYIGRHRWHERLPELRRPLSRIMVGGLGVSLAAAALLAAAAVSGVLPQTPEDARPWHYVAGFLLYDLFNLGLTAFLTCGFVLLYQGRLHRALRHFAPVGRTALTCYVGQSLVGAAIYYGWGLGLIGRLPLTAAFFLGFAIFAGQLVISAIWLRHFRFGPLEWAWRSLTYGRLQPLLVEGPREAVAAGR
jgi:uncharacterized protein